MSIAPSPNSDDLPPRHLARRRRHVRCAPRNSILLVLISAAALFSRPAESGALREVGDAAWVSANSDIVAFLAATPGECLRAPSDAESAYSVEVGRAAFRTPLLFGGPAARAGLSCNACHRDGRDNPEFFLEGFTGAPGTADVTTALFSKIREDRAFNPRPIPTLVDAAQKASFGAASPTHSLAEFIAAAVADEFQGAPPPAAVMRGLDDYVLHLSSSACPPGPSAETPARAMDDVRRALAAARKSLERKDGATADFMILAAQRGLKSLHDRYPDPSAPAERAAIAAFARDIRALRAQVRTDPSSLRRLVMADHAALRLARRLDRAVDRSLYDVARLRAAHRVAAPASQ